MSCDGAVMVVLDEPDSAGPLLDHAADRLIELEQRWSRFLPTSDVSVLNTFAGRDVHVAADTVTLVEALVHAWHATDGGFDPTLLGTLVELGYAHSRTDLSHRTSLAPGTTGRGDPAGVLVDRATNTVRLPSGTTLDPGGLGKGLAADIVTAELIQRGARGALVELGGDLRVRGEAPDACGWTIAVDRDLRHGTDEVTVGLLDGGVATSTPRLRTWTADGEHRHHLIDPATLRPSTADAVSCTVVAGSAAWAEAFTKVAFANTTATAMTTYEQHGLAASITTADGDRLTTPNWKAFER